MNQASFLLQAGFQQEYAGPTTSSTGAMFGGELQAEGGFTFNGADSYLFGLPVSRAAPAVHAPPTPPQIASGASISGGPRAGSAATAPAGGSMRLRRPKGPAIINTVSQMPPTRLCAQMPQLLQARDADSAPYAEQSDRAQHFVEENLFAPLGYGPPLSAPGLPDDVLIRFASKPEGPMRAMTSICSMLEADSA